MRISVRNIFASFNDKDFKKTKKTAQMNGEIPLEQLLSSIQSIASQYFLNFFLCSFSVHQKLLFFFPCEISHVFMTMENAYSKKQ